MTYRTEKELMDAGGECRNCPYIGPWVYELPDGTFWKVLRNDDRSSFEVLQCGRLRDPELPTLWEPHLE